MSAPLIYFDNNATTGVAPEVLEAMLPFLKGSYGNPSSMYRLAGQSKEALSTAREQVARLVGAQPEEILFTSCGTESDSTAIFSALRARPDKKHFITTRVEHPAVLALGQHLEKTGYQVTYLGVDNKGRLDLEELKAALTKDTALVSVMYANNETGNIYPVEAIGQLCKERGIPFHVDAVQAVGKIPINLASLPVDYLALSGHKLHAPKGVGALYVRRGAPFRPFLRGGHQENGRRAGTEAVPNIVALGAACALADRHFSDETTHVRALRDNLQERLLTSISESIINGDPENRLPNTMNISFKYVEGEAILLMLDQYGICASSGSACTSGSLEPSHVLRAMGVPFTYAHGSLRLSLCRYNTQQEVDKLCEVLPPVISRLREISPYKNLSDDALSSGSASCRPCQTG
ncbi:cysteine desulfurase NifS [Desulfovibrio sp. OttesenSCG-928-G15]|nr:cysteine desulfurase NifS [Desulfovibrio sp. OttesenSCG-928-G15]